MPNLALRGLSLLQSLISTMNPQEINNEHYIGFFIDYLKQIYIS